MLAEDAMALSVAAAGAAALTESIVHPLDTVICRIQSGNVSAHRAGTVSRPFDNKNLFHRLYRGFGPTVVASIPASVVFFAVYDSVKVAFSNARAAGHLGSLPHSVDYAVGSAAGELLACAILNPAQVLKQNAQATRIPSQQPANQLSRSTAAQLLKLLKLFGRQPSKLWAGYTVLVAAQLPHTCLMFSIYEGLKQHSSSFVHDERKVGDSGLVQHVQTSAICGAIAGSFSSWIFVPADVVTLRLRLAAGRAVEHQQSRAAIATVESVGVRPAVPKSADVNVLACARDIVRREGWAALFRGSLLTCIAAGVGGGVYLGSYEAIKTLYDIEEE
ncbi:hypothetical protein PV08_02862 [Exophiala spinifera]|uniref:Mitochondrial thiamine pyrophosphate carrier 1 n=1 Tax=Exophiala spinifera TaxID=91928 RepID=A0A0D2C4R9_9EURO|nr:uncharacterized protein PV08_02862 [Exophiala spinifera]KIW18574.1 hypothetical protein PV08_02862 [Exophiala spinifera]